MRISSFVIFDRAATSLLSWRCLIWTLALSSEKSLKKETSLTMFKITSNNSNYTKILLIAISQLGQQSTEASCPKSQHLDNLISFVRPYDPYSLWQRKWLGRRRAGRRPQNACVCKDPKANSSSLSPQFSSLNTEKASTISTMTIVVPASFSAHFKDLCYVWFRLF